MNDKRDSILIVDLESTCWRGHPPAGMMNEIIEIGVALFDMKKREVVESESIIVKPEYSEISYFCTELTTLTPEYVEKNGILFKDAVDVLINKYKSNKRLWGSWGKYDYNQLKKDSSRKKVNFPFTENHYNIKPLFSLKHGLDKDLGVTNALSHLNLEFEGTHHRGVDDAINIARLFNTII